MAYISDCILCMIRLAQMHTYKVLLSVTWLMRHCCLRHETCISKTCKATLEFVAHIVVLEVMMQNRNIESLDVVAKEDRGLGKAR